MSTHLSRWSGTAQAYADSFALLCEGAVSPLLDACGPLSGRTLHDVGCGVGSVSAAALDRGARVTASDADPDMVAMTTARVGASATVERRSLPATGLTNAAHDVVVAHFVVNHLPDPRAGVRELVRVAGDVVAVSVWPSEPAVQATLLQQSVARAGAEVPAGQRLPAELDFERSPDGLAALLDEAGLREVRAWEQTWDLRIAPQRLWAGVEAGIGVVGRTWQAADAPTRALMGEAWGEVVAPYVVDGEAVLPTRAVLAVGRR